MEGEKPANQKKSKGKKCLEFLRFIWNPSTKQFCGRTAKSWATIGLFYLIYYSALAAFFIAMLYGFFATLDMDRPTQTGKESLIKSNPGLGFKPMPVIESTLIKFDTRNTKTIQRQVDSIKKVLDAYRNQSSSAINCEVQKPQEAEVCLFPLSYLGDKCTEENQFGYKSGAPCVLLKINKIYGWKPEAFDNDTLADDNNEQVQEAKTSFNENVLLDTTNIPVTCEGENEADADHIGPVKMFPSTGFPTAFYPYTHQENYLPPVVFVQFEQPRRGVLIQVWCKLWAKNVLHHKMDRAGSAHFELLVD